MSKERELVFARDVEEEAILSSLPDLSLQYLAFNGIARNEILPEAQRHNARVMQTVVLSRMSDDDRQELGRYISWKTKKLQKKVLDNKTPNP